MRIQEIMSQPAVTCSSTDTLSRAAELMWKHDCGAVAVTDKDGKLVGVVTDRDACISAFTQGKALHQVPVTLAMSKQIYSAKAEDSLGAAEHLMRGKKIRRLPVVDAAGKPVGMISMNDLTRLASGSRKSAVEHEVLAVLASIGEHRPASSSLPATAKS